jgi:hypothetical protein
MSAQRAMSADPYEDRLAAWKAKHGIPAEAQALPDIEQVMIAEDANVPGRDYCMGCADKFPIRDMRLVTDPYCQFDDWEQTEDGYIPKKYRVRMCKPCFAKSYEGAEDE